MKTIKLFLLASFVLASVQGLEARTYKSDKGHTEVGFKIRHIFTPVRGKFNDYNIIFEVDDKSGNLKKISGSAQASSIDTDHAKRDKHLRSADFFDVEKYPVLKFESVSLNIKPGKKASVPGKLRIKGVAKDITLHVEYYGEVKDPWGNQKAGFTASLDKLNRKDYGLTWNKVLETGQFLVGENVKIEVHVEGNLQKAKSLPKPAPKTKN
jgi:polyisoprenoid-binding protein YceI